MNPWIQQPKPENSEPLGWIVLGVMLLIIVAMALWAWYTRDK